MYLEVGGRQIGVSSCLVNRIRITEPCDLPAGPVTFVIVVDGVARKRPFYLRHGLSKDRAEVEMDPVERSH